MGPKYLGQDCQVMYIPPFLYLEIVYLSGKQLHIFVSWQSNYYFLKGDLIAVWFRLIVYL